MPEVIGAIVGIIARLWWVFALLSIVFPPLLLVAAFGFLVWLLVPPPQQRTRVARYIDKSRM